MNNERTSSTLLFCTYCSARKRKGRTALPAIRRYLSPRIHAVHRRSRHAGAAFAILSGEFGLLGPFQKIPHYDHLLQGGEVSGLIPQMVGYLAKKGYRSVRFFHEPERRFPQIGPYLRAVRRACRAAGVRLALVEISAPRRS